jgi:hypothetical protein
MKEIFGHIAPFKAEDVGKWVGKRATHALALRWSPWVNIVESKCECKPRDFSCNILMVDRLRFPGVHLERQSVCNKSRS